MLLVAAASALAPAAPISVSAASVTSTSVTATGTSTFNFTVYTDQPSYTGSTLITVYGVAPVNAGSAMSIAITDPRGTILAGGPLAMPQNGSYRVAFPAGGPLWNRTGIYHVTVIVPQADSVAVPPTATTSFNYTSMAVENASTSASMNRSASTYNSGIISALALLAVIIVMIVFVGLMLRSRRGGVGATRTNSATASPKRQPSQ